MNKKMIRARVRAGNCSHGKDRSGSPALLIPTSVSIFVRNILRNFLHFFCCVLMKLCGARYKEDNKTSQARRLDPSQYQRVSSPIRKK